MHNIGSHNEAQTILRWVRRHSLDEGYPQCVWDEEAPEGWEYLGRGSFRSVWASPSGVAYKVGHFPADAQSQDELDNLESAWEQGPIEGCRLPMFDGFDFDGDIVVAIERIRGSVLYCNPKSKDEYYVLMRKIEKAYRLYDIHDENVMIDENDYLVPIDFGG